MRTLLPIFVLALCASVPASGQAIRFDSTATTTSAQCVSGKQCPLLVLPGTRVNFCQGTPSTLAACLASPATTYTSAAASTPCATTAQLTPGTGGSCTATADAQGGYGAWFLPGSYGYYLRVPVTAGGGTYGPYALSIHGDSGGYTLDSLYSTLAQACTAAGSGTLAITRAWNATPSQTMNCSVLFLGDGKIQTATSAAIVFGTGFTCPATQRCLDSTTNSGGSFSWTKPQENLYPQWWGATGDGSHNDTAAIQAAINATPASGTVSLFQSGNYLVSGSGTEAILISNSVSLNCSPGASIMAASGVGSSTDVIRLYGPSTFWNTNCSIIPQSGSPARRGINLDATSTFNGERAISHPMITSPKIGPFGSSAVATTFPSSCVGCGDGVFNLTIQGGRDAPVVLANGFNCDRCGDNIALRDVSISGVGPGITLNQVPGAASFLVDHATITSCSGAIKMVAAMKPTVQNSQLEASTGCAASANRAAIDLDGTMASPIYSPTIQNNRINILPTTDMYGVRYNWVIGAHDTYGQYNPGTAGQVGVLVTANAGDVTLEDPANFPYNLGLGSLLEDHGPNTVVKLTRFGITYEGAALTSTSATVHKILCQSFQGSTSMFTLGRNSATPLSPYEMFTADCLGTITHFNTTPSGNTLFLMRAGQGQSGPVMAVQNYAGSNKYSVDDHGNLLFDGSLTNGVNAGISSATCSAWSNGVCFRAITPAAFATFTSCSGGLEGQVISVSDSSTNTWGATITGGGANHVQGYCDGSNWTVGAK